MSFVIDQNQFYEIGNKMFSCCGETQFKYYCKKHTEFMGCQFCEFNPYEDCECE